MSTQTLDPLIEAAQALAGVCNYASSWDGSGYNKFDAQFGHELAKLPADRWTPRRRRAAWKMLQKYKAQLKRYGIDFDSIPEPPVVTDEQQREVVAKMRGIAEPDRKVITLEGKMLRVRFPYDPAMIDTVKRLPLPRKFDWNTKAWNFEDSPKARERLADFAQGHGFEFPAEIREAIEKARQEREWSRQASQATTADLDVEGLGATLRPFQRAGVAYLAAKQSAILADEMGLGKTVQALAAIQYQHLFPSLVICPASLKLNWARETQKWLPGRAVCVINGRIRTSGDAKRGVWIVNYDILKKYADFLCNFGFQSLIVDEAQYIKNGKAQRSKVVLALARGLDVDQLFPKEKHGRPKRQVVREPIKNTYLLSGTPFMNRPSEIINPLEVLDMLKEFGGWRKFTSRYCALERTRFGMNYTGATHLEELNGRLRELGYIRRHKTEVLTELPDKQRSVVPVALSNRAEYDRAEKDVVSFVRERAMSDEIFRQELAGMDEEEQAEAIKAHAADKAEKAARAQVLAEINTLKQLAARGKLEAAGKWIEDFLESDEKLILFGWHREVVREMAKAFSAPAILGDTPLAERQRIVDQFQDGSTRLIVLNMQAGGTGLTLTAASNVAFLEQGWNPATHDQAEDRAHRIGQKDSVNAWYLLAQNTIDDWIFELIEEKRSIVTTATEGTEAQQQAQASILGDLVQRLRQKGKGQEELL